MSATEYALLQKKFLHENLLKEATLHRDRARQREKYLLASQRNNLEQQRANLRYGLDKLPEAVQNYYLQHINELGKQVESSKKRFPMFRGDYDTDY